MLAHIPLLATLLLGLVAHATPEILETNLAYRSPYLNEPGLSIDTRAVHARHVDSHVQIKREITLGKLKRDLSGIARRDAGEIVRPDGEPSGYTYKGYGLGVTDWGTAGYVYAGNLNFTHSVASGDPFDYSVILWTRAEPTESYRIDVPMCVTYKVFTGEEGTGQVVTSGYVLTSADVDYTVKVEASGLTASTVYSYQFANCADEANVSPWGRTKTAPGKYATEVPTQRFSIYSCSNYPNGFFSAYSGPVVHQDTDYVVHLGDYIYESGSGGKAIGREPSKGKELATLDDYRKRYAQYRSDIDLSSMHAQFPIIAIWDDHETADNDFKAGSSRSNDSLATGGCAYSGNTTCFTDREAHAKRAYHEWIPIRAVDISDESRIWRDFRFGDLVDVIALDTRKYDRDITDLYYNTEYISTLATDLDSERSIIGPKQEGWFLDTLKASKDRGTKWRMILNQVIFSSFNGGQFPGAKNPPDFAPNFDAWDGYQAVRKRVLDHVYNEQIDNIAIFTGDTHANWLFETDLSTVYAGSNDPSTLRNVTTTENSYQRGGIVEFGGTAVSSNGWGASYLTGANATELGSKNYVGYGGGLLYSEGFYRGYMLAEVSYDAITVSYFGYPGSLTGRVSNNRTLGFQAVQLADMNQVQRPLTTPTEGFGATKRGN